jgi:hypothetical protein
MKIPVGEEEIIEHNGIEKKKMSRSEESLVVF